MAQELQQGLENLKRAERVQKDLIKALKRGYFPASETQVIQPGIDYLKGLGRQVAHAIKEQEAKIKEASQEKPVEVSGE